MRKFIIAFIVSLICIYIVHFTIFDNAYTLESLSNAFFVVGLMMFFISLITITDATKIFSIMSYSFKSLLRRHSFKYKSYHDYMMDKQREKVSPYAMPAFIISFAYIMISLILAHYVIQGYA